MIKAKEIAHLEVYRDRTRVGTLTRTKDGSIFKYTDGFLMSSAPPIAFHLPKSPDGIEARGTTNLPAFFAGLLPEGVMQEAICHSQQISRDDLFSQLAVTGFDAIGDVTIRVPGHEVPISPSNLTEVAKRINDLLHGKRFDAANTVSGVQPKLSVGQAVASMRGLVAIVKTEPDRFPGILANEAYFMGLAREAGLRAAEVKLEGDLLVANRFDRVKRKGVPPAQIHVEDALQLMNYYPLAKYSLDYLEIMNCASGLGVAKSVHLDLLRLYVYSYIIANGDLHGKNVSFQYSPATGQWLMTPAYDLVCTLPYFLDDAYGRHMALPLDGQYGDFTVDELTRVGIRYGLPDSAVKGMIKQVSSAVQKGIAAGPVPVSDAVVEVIRSRAIKLA